MRIAIVGAGMAGLACARALAGPGRELVLFDKGRRPGGRVATRRSGELTFNHGAQYATARGADFQAALAGLRESGVVAPWEAAGEGRWVGVPGMSALPARLAAELAAAGATLRTGRQVTQLAREDAGWALRHHPADQVTPGALTDRGGELERFDAVLLAVPHPQAAPLLRAAGQAAMAARLDAVVVAPCWTLMLAYAEPVAGPDVRRLDGPLAWLAREGSRPGGPSGPDRWVANAAPAWTRERLERPAAEVAPELLALVAAVTGVAAAPMHMAAHRWRYALTEHALGEPALWDPATRIGLCGDWCLDGRVEAAWESGRALAAMLTAG